MSFIGSILLFFIKYVLVIILLFQAVQTIFELPLDFQNETVHSKLTNWELAADIVNVTSKVRRSGKQVCDHRFFSMVFLFLLLPCYRVDSNRDHSNVISIS